MKAVWLRNQESQAGQLEAELMQCSSEKVKLQRDKEELQGRMEADFVA